MWLYKWKVRQSAKQVPIRKFNNAHHCFFLNLVFRKFSLETWSSANLPNLINFWVSLQPWPAFMLFRVVTYCSNWSGVACYFGKSAKRQLNFPKTPMIPEKNEPSNFMLYEQVFLSSVNSGCVHKFLLTQ